MNNSEVLIIENVYKGYGENNKRVEILKGVDLKLYKSDFAMLIGPSGSGKSTILHTVAGLTTVDQGSINACGIDVVNCSKNKILQLRREKIGFVFQDSRLLQGLTALENVMVPLLATGVTRKDAQPKAEELLNFMGLSDRMDYFPHKLSGGEFQRVGIARSLANNPDLILADEPTGNLDQELSHEVVKVMASLPKKYGTTILMVTHNPNMLKYATKIVKLQNGKLEMINHDLSSY